MTGLIGRLTPQPTPEQLRARQYQQALTAELGDLASKFVAASERTENTTAQDERLQGAASLRFVAARTARKGDTKLAEMWIQAATSTLAYYDRADLDEVHASRSSRREAKNA